MRTAKGNTVKFVHPQLGTIKGLVSIEGVHQFRSVPYATIPHRFADPVLADSFGTEGEFDATEFGAIAPQPDNAEAMEYPSPKEQIPHAPLEMNEFTCTNLNITIPTGERKSSGGLPVMVWFHGGSYMLGAASWPQYSMLLLCRG